MTTTQTATDRTVAPFNVKYDGESLRTHEMDVKQLAPALLSLSEAFDRIQRHSAPDARVSLKARATREGSFNIELILSMVNNVFASFDSTEANGMLNAAALVKLLIEAVKLMKQSVSHGGKPRKDSDAQPGEDGLSKFNVTFPDGTSLMATGDALELIRDEDFVKNVKATLSPALKDGVDSVSFSTNGFTDTVNSEEASAISGYSVDDDDVFESDVREMVIQTLDVSFRDGGKWRITDGSGNPHFVVFEDADFIGRIDRGEESFRKGDLYKVNMRVEKRIDDAGHLEMRYVAVEKVIWHHAASDQPSLF